MKAYTYTLIHKQTRMIYYGCRKSSTFDLLKTYFTSSKLVKRIINEEGINLFEPKLRRKFDSYEESRKHETKFLQKVNAIKNPRFYNQAISSPRICSKDSISESKRRKAISIGMKRKWKDESYKSQFIDPTKPHSKYRIKVKKIRPKHLSLIERNGSTKLVENYQVPQYKKYGWSRIKLVVVVGNDPTREP